MENIKDNNQPEANQNLIADYADEIKQIELEGYEKAVKKARNALFWTAGLLLLGEIISGFRDEYQLNIFTIIAIVIEVGIFIALAMWTRKKPYTAIMAGIIAFIGLQLLLAVIIGISEGVEVAAKSLFSGIIVKVAILVTLFRAVADAKELQQSRESVK